MDPWGEFSIDAETRTHMSDPRVLSSLKVKISRERVGVELEKMLKGKELIRSWLGRTKLTLFRQTPSRFVTFD